VPSAPVATESGSAETGILTVTEITADTTTATDEIPAPKTVACQARRFRVVFDPDRGALVTSEGRVLASSGVTGWSTSSTCPGARSTLERSSGEAPPGVYESAAVDCLAPRPVRIDVHAVTTGGGRFFGSNLVVYFPHSPTWLVSVAFVEDPAGRRIYYNRTFCSRAG
jgi:hypothetical protein